MEGYAVQSIQLGVEIHLFFIFIEFKVQDTNSNGAAMRVPGGECCRLKQTDERTERENEKRKTIRPRGRRCIYCCM